MHRAAAKFMWFFPFPPLPFLPPHYQKQRHLEACLEFREVVNDVPFPPYSPDLVPRDCFVLYNESEVRRERERGGGRGAATELQTVFLTFREEKTLRSASKAFKSHWNCCVLF